MVMGRLLVDEFNLIASKDSLQHLLMRLDVCSIVVTSWLTNIPSN